MHQHARLPAVTHFLDGTDEDRPGLAASLLLYVDADANAGAPPDQCPGDGSSESPFRSLHCAFASGSITTRSVSGSADHEGTNH